MLGTTASGRKQALRALPERAAALRRTCKICSFAQFSRTRWETLPEAPDGGHAVVGVQFFPPTAPYDAMRHVPYLLNLGAYTVHGDERNLHVRRAIVAVETMIASHFSIDAFVTVYVPTCFCRREGQGTPLQSARIDRTCLAARRRGGGMWLRRGLVTVKGDRHAGRWYPGSGRMEAGLPRRHVRANRQTKLGYHRAQYHCSSHERAGARTAMVFGRGEAGGPSKDMESVLAGSMKAGESYDRFIVKFSRETLSRGNSAQARLNVLNAAGRGVGLSNVRELRELATGGHVITTDRKLNASEAQTFAAGLATSNIRRRQAQPAVAARHPALAQQWGYNIDAAPRHEAWDSPPRRAWSGARPASQAYGSAREISPARLNRRHRGSTTCSGRDRIRQIRANGLRNQCVARTPRRNVLARHACRRHNRRAPNNGVGGAGTRSRQDCRCGARHAAVPTPTSPTP